MSTLWLGCTGAAGYQQQQLAAAWRAYLAWECSNPQKLTPPELAARVSLAYDQALMPLRLYPDVRAPPPPPYLPAALKHLVPPQKHIVPPCCAPLVVKASFSVILKQLLPEVALSPTRSCVQGVSTQTCGPPRALLIPAVLRRKTSPVTNLKQLPGEIYVFVHYKLFLHMMCTSSACLCLNHCWK